MSNQRQHPRLPVSLTVSYPSRGDMVRDLVTNLSPGGLFVRTSKPLPIGTEVDLEVQVAGDETLNVRGKVVWLRDRATANAPEGMGIQFTGVMGEVLATLVADKAEKG
jgi:uncharacterized protein (TIGR02266 family)